ncbi:MAG TPA: hypothetical protein VFY68_06725 [Nitrososphaeraceae archaeon]|nr:hypothetical protein [Nitrososphaeraceae archaeon]
MHNHPALSMLVGALVVVFTAGINPSFGTLSGEETVSRSPEQSSKQITQAKEDINSEVMKQGEIITHEIKEQFGFENIQSNLTQAYQNSFSGELNSAMIPLQTAESALEDSIISLLRSGQQLISVSNNQTITLENNTRNILNTFGESLSNLSVSTNQIQSQLSQLD